METRETCVMVFTTSRDGQHTVRVRDPRPALNLSVVTAAADTFIGTNVFDSTIGSLQDFLGAEIVTETTTTVI